MKYCIIGIRKRLGLVVALTAFSVVWRTACVDATDVTPNVASGSKNITVCVANIAPNMGACYANGTYTGYDYELWGIVTQPMGLVSSYKCVDDADAAIENVTNGLCDVAIGGITHTIAREDTGARFSSASYTLRLFIVYYSQTPYTSIWTFLRPLSVGVWMALIATGFIVPWFVYGLEFMLSSRMVYKEGRAGKRNMWFGIKEATWHAFANMVGLESFSAYSTPARLVVLIYAFVNFIILTSFTSALTAYITVGNIDQITGIASLQGASVATVNAYVNVTAAYDIPVIIVDGGQSLFDQTFPSLQNELYKAVVVDDFVAWQKHHDDCSFRVADDPVEYLSIAWAFGRNVSNITVNNISKSLSALQAERTHSEDSTIGGLLKKFALRPEDVNQEECHGWVYDQSVKLRPLFGSFVIVAATIALGMFFASATYLYRGWWRRNAAYDVKYERGMQAVQDKLLLRLQVRGVVGKWKNHALPKSSGAEQLDSTDIGPTVHATSQHSKFAKVALDALRAANLDVPNPATGTAASAGRNGGNGEAVQLDAGDAKELQEVLEQARELQARVQWLLHKHRHKVASLQSRRRDHGSTHLRDITLRHHLQQLNDVDNGLASHADSVLDVRLATQQSARHGSDENV